MPSRKNYKKKSVKKGGNCGCNKGFFTGGVALGPVSAVDVGSQSTIPFNNYHNDPLSPAAQDATRMDPNPIAPFNPFTGGKKSRRKIVKRKKIKRTRKTSRRRRIRGGSDPASDAILNGSTLSFGTVAGAPIGANIVMGNTLPILNPPLSNSAAPFI